MTDGSVSLPWPPHIISLASAPPGSPHGSPFLLPGFLTSRSFSPPSSPPHLLPSHPASTSFLTFSPARPPLFLHPQGEGSDTPSRAAPRAGGAGLGGWRGERRGQCATPPAHCAGFGCCRGRSGVCEPLAASFHPHPLALLSPGPQRLVSVKLRENPSR